MKSFVLVPGAWHGGWCWRRVIPHLRAAGHEAYPVTLTGVGERAHLLSPDVRLATHIRDVVALIENEELDDVVLVGHSYGGMVITGVADRLLQQEGAKLERLVYLDAITPYPGESWSSQHPKAFVEARVKAAAQAGNVSIPPPDAATYGLVGADREWVNRRQTPQPFGVYQEPLAFDAVRVASVARTYIECTAPAVPVLAVMRRRVRTDPGWTVRELATGHDAMVSLPQELAQVLVKQ